MHHSIFKQHQVHSSYEIVVADHSFSEQFVQLLPVHNGHVLRLTDTAREVTVDVRALEDYALVYFLGRKGL